MKFILKFSILALLIGCSSARIQAPLSSEEKLKRAEVAFQKERTPEARKWLEETLRTKPRDPKAQAFMAKVIDREIVQEKSLSQAISPEDLLPKEKKLQIKTWLERSQTYLQINQFDEALLAAEKVFRLDPENREASRLIDQIKEEARKQGKDESLFLQDLYQEEIQTRIRHYQEQAESWLKAGKPGAARLALEKILIFDPNNSRARRLLASLEKNDPLIHS